MNLTKLLAIIISACLVCAIIYGSYWVIKTTSYKFFYEDMVQRTVTEMVRRDCLQ